jgi:serine/threonine-protein kinase
LSEPEDSVPTLAQTSAEGSASFVITLDLRPGAVFHSRYEVMEPLGRGGMGMVFKARDRVLEETVAIKVLRPDVAQDARMAERFKSEIKLARRVRHRNVCAIHDYGEDQGLFFISMELVEGEDLKRRLREGAGLPPEQAYDIAIQVAEGLQAVHEAGIVHRDLKTPNIMIDAQGVARLMDFGVAKRLGESTVTTTGQVVGTPEYMSPEQAQGHGVDCRSDVYALGIVVYEVFTGRVPFRGDTPISTILKHINDPPPLDGPQASALPPTVRDVLRRALAKDPNQRYATAREMGEALRGARTPSSKQVPLSTTALQAPTVKRRRRRLLGRVPAPLQPWLLALPAVAVAGGAVWLQMQTRSAPAPVTETPGGAAVALPSAAPTVFATPAPPVPSRAAPSFGVAPTAPPVTLNRPGVAAMPRATPRPAPPPVATTLPAASAAPPPTMPAAAAPTTVPGPPGHLQVVVRPWGEVTVDGRVVGQTPLDRITLGAGRHTVRVRYGNEVWDGEVTIRSGQVEKVTVDFTARGRR